MGKTKGTAAASRVNKSNLDSGYPKRDPRTGKVRVDVNAVSRPRSKQERDRRQQENALRNE